MVTPRLLGLDSTLSLVGKSLDVVLHATRTPNVPRATINSDYTVSPTSADAGPVIQSYLDDAAQGSFSSYWAFLRRSTNTVTLAPGTYYIRAKSDNTPSLVVPRGVVFDFSKANLVFEYPSTTTTQWSAILTHSQASVIVGRMRPIGFAPSNDQVYDGIRMYHSDNTTRVEGFGVSTISNFKGAGIRTLGSYVIHIKDILFEFNTHGIIHGHSTGLVKDNTYPYAVPTQDNNEATGPTRRPTDMWVQDCYFNSLRGDGIVVGAIGSATQPNEVSLNTTDNITGGNLYLDHVMFEGIPARAIVARELSQVQLHDVHLEEVGPSATQGVSPMIDFDVVYGSISVKGLRINISGGRSLTGLSGSTTASPSHIFKLGANRSFSAQDIYVQNSFKDITFSTSEPWTGAWGSHQVSGLAADVANSGRILTSSTLPTNNFSGFSVSATGKPGDTFVVGGKHFWYSAGKFRTKNSAPLSPTDGNELLEVTNTGSPGQVLTQTTRGLAFADPGSVPILPAYATGLYGSLIAKQVEKNPLIHLPLNDSTSTLAVAEYGSSPITFQKTNTTNPTWTGSSARFVGESAITGSTIQDLGSAFTFETLVYTPNTWNETIYADGRLFFGTKSMTHINQTGGSSNQAWWWDIPTMQWVHYVVTWDGTTARLFLNGTQRTTAPLTNTFSASIAPRIGVDRNNANRLSGNAELAALAIYSRALTQEEITAHHASITQ